MNLFSTAVEAMTTGGHVHISSEYIYVDSKLQSDEIISENEYAVLTIAVEGSGIAAEYLDRINETFYSVFNE